MMDKPNLLLLGASGAVAGAFLRRLPLNRGLLGRLILLDRDDSILSNTFLDHDVLAYEFIHRDLRLPKDRRDYIEMLKKHGIDIVIDLTDMPTMPVFNITNRMGISYINTATWSQGGKFSDVVFEIYDRMGEFDRAAHIFCTGMNPGIVNMWVRYGIEKFGVPREVVHFEYDTSELAGGWKPMTTWSKHAFIDEVATDSTGFMLGRDNLKEVFPNGLKNMLPMQEILEPIMKLDDYPDGFLVMHDENITIAQKYDVPSKFVYAVNMKTMGALIELYDRKGTVSKDDLILGDNTTCKLSGSDGIGVMLEYDDKRVYYFNTITNSEVAGTSATCLQVATGVYAALFTLLTDSMENGAYFVEDIFDTSYKNHVFDNMQVQEFVFSRNNGGLKLISHEQKVKPEKNNSKSIRI
ncbi:MAG: hypothetical protein V1744_05305 [Candidatus Altiarchaeota archaeon]